MAGGRHSLYAFEDGALAIDLRLMDSVEVNPETKTSNYQSCAAAVCLFVCLFVFGFCFCFCFFGSCFVVFCDSVVATFG